MVVFHKKWILNSRKIVVNATNESTHKGQISGNEARFSKLLDSQYTPWLMLCHCKKPQPLVFYIDGFCGWFSISRRFLFKNVFFFYFYSGVFYFMEYLITKFNLICSLTNSTKKTGKKLLFLYHLYLSSFKSHQSQLCSFISIYILMLFILYSFGRYYFLYLFFAIYLFLIFWISISLLVYSSNMVTFNKIQWGKSRLINVSILLKKKIV